MKSKYFFTVVIAFFLLFSCSCELLEFPEREISEFSVASPSESQSLDWKNDGFVVPGDLKEEIKTEDIAKLEFAGEYITVINGNKPYFSLNNRFANPFVYLSPLDTLGRAGLAVACIGSETLNLFDRSDSYMPDPSGWHSYRYEHIEGKYLYNRSHLLGVRLVGNEFTVKENLFTGTRQLNVVSMLEYEDIIFKYVQNTNNHVLYRVTPVFSQSDLVVRGVVLEASSVEDNGASLCFCVYIFNVQAGVTINYADGSSKIAH